MVELDQCPHCSRFGRFASRAGAFTCDACKGTFDPALWAPAFAEQEKRRAAHKPREVPMPQQHTKKGAKR